VLTGEMGGGIWGLLEPQIEAVLHGHALFAPRPLRQRQVKPISLAIYISAPLVSSCLVEHAAPRIDAGDRPFAIKASVKSLEI
jgi:hypothetical protein